MTNSVIDYTEGSSFLHKANPITKVFLAIELFAAGILASNCPAICFVIALTLFINVISGNAKKRLSFWEHLALSAPSCLWFRLSLHDRESPCGISLPTKVL